MTPRKRTKRGVALLAAAIVCLMIGTTAFAAYQYLSAKEFAASLGDRRLARYFDSSETAPVTMTDGDYTATLLGIVSGENLSELAPDVHSDRTYAVVAVEKADGSEMTLDDPVCVSPLVQGLKPWQFNIAAMQGGAAREIRDGVLYQMIECGNIEYFADRNLYMAVTDRPFINNQPFAFDESTGLISANEAYDGTNILFDLELDKAKANPQKAAEYLASLQAAETEQEDEAANDGGAGEGDSDRQDELEVYSEAYTVTEEDGAYFITN